MPTRSKPIVSCTSIACAIATLVPTPSVGGGQQRPVVALEGGGVEQAGEAAEAADHLRAGGPCRPRPSSARRPCRRPRSTRRRRRRRPRGSVGRARSRSAPGSGVVEDGQRLAETATSDASSRCLPSRLSSGSVDGVLAGEAGRAEPLGRSGRSPRPCPRARCSRGCRRRRSRRSRRRRARWRSARRGWRSRCRRSTATSPAGWRSGRAPRARRPRAASAPGRAGCCRARSSRRRRRSACRGSCARAR